MVCVIKRLTIRGWTLAVWPWLLRRRIAGRGAAVSRCEIFEGSPRAFAVARVSGRLLGVEVERLRFSLTDVRDARGLWMRLVVTSEDLAEVQRDIEREPSYRQARDAAGLDGRWPRYAAKALTPVGFTNQEALWCVLLAIRVAAWRRDRVEAGAPAAAAMFVDDRPWFDVIARYAGRHGMALRALPPALDLRAWARRRLSPWLQWRRRRQERREARRSMTWSPLRSPGGEPLGWIARGAGSPPAGRIAVDDQGYLNLSHPERYSDLFFWPESPLAARDLVLCAPGGGLAAREASSATVAQAGIDVARLDSHRAAPMAGRARRASRWLREQRQDYDALRAYWASVCQAAGIAVHVTWFKYDRLHYALADAVQETGGVTAIYQRAYESCSSPHLAVAPDVFFGFAAEGMEMERRSGSAIPYYVVTGYLGDHRFALLRDQARRTRARLQAAGASRIVAFADENTAPTPSPWHPNHDIMRRYYSGLLERVLAEPWFGLVLKPKVPSTLRRRLGPVAELLARAEATGRCVLYEGGGHQGDWPPVAAALAADVMIHGYLFAATAGVESALAGVPTLVLDHEGWHVSPLERLGRGQVIFNDMERAWSACSEHWQRPGGVPGFGDWAPVLEACDPFRDGRAAQRMGAYLAWLLEGLRAGRGRDAALAEAAERYAARWGSDKIGSVNAGRPLQRAAAPMEPTMLGAAR